nr:probable cyclopropane-fatty-acyl-phospholipid synthase [Kibdelosporangium sp. MJ126-NF4]CTQ99085.1 probable cyclopropane-fatty-acyl-phospholipid synthase(EC:2.1.1.79) [Kibdelosporangium sp. MJ126-NF4]
MDTDEYRARVERVYADDPAQWKVAIGPELWFEFGVYDGESGSLDDVGQRYFDQQLELAGLHEGATVNRILDVGFGWGTTLAHMAKRFPGCTRLDGVNISETQIRYAAARLAESGVDDRVHLYRCDARDISHLPDQDPPYDLVIFRGSIAHFTDGTLEAAVAAVSARTRAGSTVLISDPLYTVPTDRYSSAMTDETDRLACGNRKTLSALIAVLERHGFSVADIRELPSNADSVRWLMDVKANIDEHFPIDRPRALQEMADVSVNLAAAMDRGLAAVYSVVARRRPEPA